MCGIIGYAGHRPAIPLILEGLKKLEYRGYDSSGVSFVHQQKLQIVRSEGKLSALKEKLATMEISLATSGIGHTRWATHGAPTENNAHPHKSHKGNLCIVHNGIIEDYLQHKNNLEQKGVHFCSQTDSEVLANIIADEIENASCLLEGFASALRKVDGAYAVALISLDEPNTIYAARHAAPLLLGVGTGENFIASDIPAFLSYTRNVVFLQDDEIVTITPDCWSVFSLSDLSPLERAPQTINWDMQSAQKDGYRHFMLKEIYEQPKTIIDSMAGRIDMVKKSVLFSELEGFPVPSRLRIVACGTSYHAGLWALPLLEDWAKIPTSVEIASEFRYRNPLLDKNEAILVISQSGETADTLAALRIAKKYGSKVVGICNVTGSSIARESDAVVYTQAGPEISVASTKSLCSQMLVLLLLAMHWGQQNDTIPDETAGLAIKNLALLPSLLQKHLPAMQEKAETIAAEYAHVKSMFFLGRGQSYALALEGALKIKELSYIHAEGYAAGEMKHGPIALIEPGFPSFILLPHDSLFLKSKSNLEEIRARSGPVIALTNEGDTTAFDVQADCIWVIPRAWGPLTSFYFTCFTALKL